MLRIKPNIIVETCSQLLGMLFHFSCQDNCMQNADIAESKIVEAVTVLTNTFGDINGYFNSKVRFSLIRFSFYFLFGTKYIFICCFMFFNHLFFTNLKIDIKTVKESLRWPVTIFLWLWCRMCNSIKFRSERNNIAKLLWCAKRTFGLGWNLENKIFKKYSF